MKIHDAFTEYFTNLKINEGKSKRTVSSYTNDLKQYIRFLEEHSITNTKKIKAESVSYTHLDVYKRQGIYCSF